MKWSGGIDNIGQRSSPEELLFVAIIARAIDDKDFEFLTKFYGEKVTEENLLSVVKHHSIVELMDYARMGYKFPIKLTTEQRKQLYKMHYVNKQCARPFHKRRYNQAQLEKSIVVLRKTGLSYFGKKPRGA